MASSRVMRSRRSSPMDHSVKESLPSRREDRNSGPVSRVGDVWTEPPLRNPAPSFEDYKGLERHGVLENMLPLGFPPNQKVKLRFKQHEPPRRKQPNGDRRNEGTRTPDPTSTALPTLRKSSAANGETAETAEEPGLPPPNPIPQHSGSSKAEESAQKPLPPREREFDKDYHPPSVKSPASHPILTPSKPIDLSLNVRTPEQDLKYRQVVEVAVDRSYEIGNPVLGLGIRRLYEESKQDKFLAELLRAVLTQNQTPEQTTDFELYLKDARKQVRAENGMSKYSSSGRASISKSKSPSMSRRTSVAAQNRPSKDVLHAPVPPSPQTNTITKLPSRQHPAIMEAQETPSKVSRSSKRLKRSKSASSTSSLSSLGSAGQAFDRSIDSGQGAAGTDSTSVRAINDVTHRGPKMHTWRTSKPSKPSQPQPKRSFNAMDQPAEPSADAIATKRRRLQKTFEDYTIKESNVRSAVRPVRQLPTPASNTPVLTSSTPPASRTRSSAVVKVDEEDSPDSPLSSVASIDDELLVPPPPGARASSGERTPIGPGRSSKPLKLARTKMSPIKNKTGGVVAGKAPPDGTKFSPVGNGHLGSFSEDDSNNVDYCLSCGGNGELLCCDGCEAAFHFSCLDPPEHQNGHVGPWFCNKCQEKRNPQPVPSNGLFAHLEATVQKKNPQAYQLPEKTRVYFENIKTGEEGEYDESVEVKPAKTTRSGFDEIPDNFKLQDAKNNIILCYKCRQSAMGKREMASCDYCDLHWHLDCLDPPLATAPRKLNNGNPRNTWMCPAHIDHELKALKPQKKSTGLGVNSGPLGKRSFKVRKPRNARIVDVSLRRGFKNNGLIEIISDSSDSEEGIIHRISQRGLKLDFIDKVKTDNRRQKEREQRKAAQIEAQRKADRDAFNQRTLIDRQAALNLVNFAQQQPDLSFGGDQVQSLINALITEAPSPVMAEFAKEEAKKNAVPSKEERESLKRLQELIKRRLEAGSDAE